MPKRFIDGERLWRSDKIAALHPSIKAEYAWLLPLADPWGSFQFDPRDIWARCYAKSRPEISPENVEHCLYAFHRPGGLLFLWRDTENGKIYGHWVGIDAEGLLPPPAKRTEGQRLAPPLPVDLLQAYVSEYGQERQIALLPPTDSSLIPIAPRQASSMEGTWKLDGRHLEGTRADLLPVPSVVEASRADLLPVASVMEAQGGLGFGSVEVGVLVGGGNGPAPPPETKTLPETERTPRQLADLAWIALTWWAQVPGEDASKRAWTERVATLKPAGAFEAALAAVGGGAAVYEKYLSRKLDFLHRTFIDSFMTACETAAPATGGKA